MNEFEYIVDSRTKLEKFDLKTSTWNEYVFGLMSNPTYVISLSPQAKWYVLIWLKYLIPLTCLNWTLLKLKWRPWEKRMVSRLKRGRTCLSMSHTAWQSKRTKPSFNLIVRFYCWTFLEQSFLIERAFSIEIGNFSNIGTKTLRLKCTYYPTLNI